MNAILKKQRGFTIVELLIVIVVIGILAAITVVAYNGIQERARDTQRRSDLSVIAKLAAVRAVENDDTALRFGDTCTTGNNGFFNQTGIALTGTNYGANSTMMCLQEATATTASLTDPSGATSCANGAPSTCFVYMFASCNLGTFIYAHLEAKPPDSTATDDTCQPDNDTSWGINYYVKV